MIKSLRKLIRRLSMLRPLPARCSFCRRSYDVAGPFAEGYKSVLICADCSVTCQVLIAKKRKNLSQAVDATVEIGQREPQQD
jgi:hypothetical protein